MMRAKTAGSFTAERNPQRSAGQPKRAAKVVGFRPSEPDDARLAALLHAQGQAVTPAARNAFARNAFAAALDLAEVRARWEVRGVKPTAG